MALVNGFPGHSGQGTFANLRRDLEGSVVRSASGVMRAGLFPGSATLLVTGRADMKVDVADFRGVQNRGGAIFLANDGVAQVTLDAAPASNKRIDLVYVFQQSTTLGDAADVPVFGVVKGTASATPSVPSLPSAVATAIPLATVEIPAGATTTSSAGVVISQVFPWTAMAGGTVHVRNSVELAAWAPVDGSTAFNIQTGRIHTRVGGAWVEAGTRRTVTITTNRASFTTGFINSFNLAVVSGETTDSSIVGSVPAVDNKITITEAGFYSVTWFADYGTLVTSNSPIAMNRGAAGIIHQANCTAGQFAVTLGAPDVYFAAGDELVFYANKVAGATASFTGKLVISKAR